MTEINFFNNASDVGIHNSQFLTFINTDNNKEDGLRLLYDVTSKDAAHYAARPDPPSRCHPDTRKTLLRVINTWAGRQTGPPVLWLKGTAGMGKTTIAQTVCEDMQELGSLAGDFFFCRPSRADHRPLFVTLAYRLAVFHPLLKMHILREFLEDPALAHSTAETQLQRLVINPLLQVNRADIPDPLFIVIDGLDECEGSDWQAHIVQLIANAVRDCDLSLRFLITSRPEPWIEMAFRKYFSTQHLLTIPIHRTLEADVDIRTYLDTEFERIRDEHPEWLDCEAGGAQWPSERDLLELIHRASGQFIYAATVIRYLNEAGCRPMERLRQLLQTTAPNGASGLVKLDELYDKILSAGQDHKLTQDVLTAVSVIFAGVPASDDMHAHMLDIIEHLLGLAPGDASRALRHLHSVVRLPKRCGPPQPKGARSRFYHPSFEEFLHNSARSRRYHIDPLEANRFLAVACLDYLQGITQPRISPTASLAYTYALQHGYLRIKNSGHEGNTQLLERLVYFNFSESLFAWLELSPHSEERRIWRKLAKLRIFERLHASNGPSDADTKNRVGNVAHLVAQIRLHWLHILKQWLEQQTDLHISPRVALLSFKLWLLGRALPPLLDFKVVPGDLLPADVL